MSEPRFIEVAPEGFEITCELKWITEVTEAYGGTMLRTNIVLCQKWQGAFRDVWVRVPSE